MSMTGIIIGYSNCRRYRIIHWCFPRYWQTRKFAVEVDEREEAIAGCSSG